MSEPRVYWANAGLKETKGALQIRTWVSDFERPETIDLVEKSAYLEQKARAERAEAERDQLRSKLLEERRIAHENYTTMRSEFERKLQVAVRALEQVVGRTHSWVIAEQTIDCKHTYDSIRVIANMALQGIGETK